MISYSDAILLREMIGNRGGYPRQLTLHQLQLVARAMHDDLDLTATALTMTPRPRWVFDIAAFAGIRVEREEAA